jgi:Arc/MetJ-type ribon-helix-helix transcriptional regulator
LESFWSAADTILSPSDTLPPVREPKVTIKIPRPLYRKVQQVVADSGFDSPTDFIVYVLRDLLGESPHGTSSEPRELEPREFTKEELEDVRRKLQNLGYL